MTRDASIKTQDMLLLEEMRLDIFDYDIFHRYRITMKNYRPGHVWEELDDVDFLYRLGAIGRSSDGKMHPLIKMFDMVDIGERAGSGIPNIFNVWEKQGWTTPKIAENIEPERITLSLQIEKSSDKNNVI